MNNKGQESFGKRFSKKALGNQGQAFSVFELMIAAIVAVAILFVLLPIISGGFSFNTTPKDAISNSLSAVKEGGQTTSQDFTLEPSQTLKSSQFTDDGFDAHSIVFAVEDKLYSANSGKFEVQNSDSDFSYITYSGSTPQPAKAIVVCEQTGLSLEETIGISSSIIQDAENADNVTDLCQEEEYQPCCVVIIQRQ